MRDSPFVLKMSETYQIRQNDFDVIFPADLVTFVGKILNGKLLFLCSVTVSAKKSIVDVWQGSKYASDFQMNIFKLKEASLNQTLTFHSTKPSIRIYVINI